MNHNADWLDQVNDWRDGVSSSPRPSGEGGTEPHTPRFASRLRRHGGARGGARLPAPGQVVDLDKIHETPDPEPAPEPGPVDNPTPPTTDPSPAQEDVAATNEESETEQKDVEQREGLRDTVRRRIGEWAEAVERWAGVGPPEQDTDPADTDNPPTDTDTGGQTDTDAQGTEPQHGRLRRWISDGNHQRPTYYDTPPAPRQSLIQWWQSRDAPTRWLAYNGTALGAGFWLGLPQWFTDATAYLVDTYDTWHDWHLVPWYAAGLAIWTLDHHTRNWIFIVALPCRIPLISMVVGCLLYGSPDLHV